MREILFFNRINMVEYFKKFDYLDIKSMPLFNKLFPVEKSYSKEPPSIDYLKKAFCDYELRKNHTIYSDINYLDIREKIKIIYGDDNAVAEEMVFLYDFASNRLLDRYIDIDTLVKLFNHHFFEFEWQQHTGINFDKNDLSFYRDHFIHQIRNCYMILRLLDGREDIGNSFNGESSVLMKKIIGAFKTQGTELLKSANIYVNQYYDNVKKNVDIVLRNYNRLCNSSKVDERELNNCIDNYSWEYFIRGSLIIAALFHDIGYPVEFMYKNMDRLSDFVASIVPQDSLGFDRLNDLLGSSLLFTIVNKKKLRYMYDKRDHGALSAFILLLHFYETGTIHSLNPIKKAMIEFAALAIFNHTIAKYYDKHKDELYKPSFSADPLSYTLRFVDDLQEWERVYFEIRETGDLRYCETCKMPIGKIWSDDIKRQLIENAKSKINTAWRNANIPGFGQIKITDNISDEQLLKMVFPDGIMERVYSCGCEKRINSDAHSEYMVGSIKSDALCFFDDNLHYKSGIFEKGIIFPDKKINYTVISTNAVVVGNNYDISKVDNELCRLKFYLDYDPFRTFYLIKINPKALDYRIDDLKKLNDQFKLQSNVEFEMVPNLTNNPLMLKLRILCDFLYELGHYIYNYKQYCICVKDGLQEANKYLKMINPLYVKLIPGMTEKFPKIYSLVMKLKECHFFVYDYDDEGLHDDTCEPDITCLEKVVSYFMDYQSKTNNNKTQMIRNLQNTLECLIKMLQTTINNNREGDKKQFVSLFHKDFQYIDERHKNACRYLFDDAVSQLFHFCRDGSLIRYYEESFDKELMLEANRTIFDPRYYNPQIIMREIINKTEFTFFDAFSDLYLFKEMNRFAQDNFSRRMEKNKA